MTTRDRATPLTGLSAATALLTRFPVGPQREPAHEAPWFPVVGAATGLLVAAVLLAAGTVLPAAAAALLAVGLELALTGALHLDGLADTADAAGGHDRARRLAIMRDHSIGVYGAAALVLDLGLRTACLSAILSAPLPAGSVIALLVAAWTVSRAAMLAPAALLAYARPDGTGRSFVTRLTTADAVVGTGVAVVLVAVLAVLVPTPGWQPFVAVLLAAALTTALLSRWSAAMLGGITGDVLGAVAELALVAALLMGTAWS